MSQIVSFKTVCDKCHQTVSEGTPAAEQATVLALGSNSAEVDLCRDCELELEGLLLPIIKRGLKGAGRSRTGGGSQRVFEKVRCEDCGKPYKVGAGITLHRVRMHSESNGQVHHEDAAVGTQ